MWKFITGRQGITTQVCKLEVQFCPSTHIAHNGNAVKGQKPVNTEGKNWSRGGGVTSFSINSEKLRLFNVSIFAQIRNTTAWISETTLQADHRDENGWKAGDIESESCMGLQKCVVFSPKHFR